MKKKTKVIASAVATIALCASLSVGGTFALFTSESKVNVAISSGTVDVVAQASELALYSAQAAQDGTLVDENGFKYEYANVAGEAFTNGGTAKITDGNTVKLDKMTPGDKVTFKIDVTNDSDVAVQYRTLLMAKTDKGLFSGLNITINGDTYQGWTAVSDWATLSPDQNNVESIPVEIELPITADDEYQNKSCQIEYCVEAVQGNATVENQDTENNVYVYTATDFMNWGKSVNAGTSYKNKTIQIMRNISFYNTGLVWKPVNLRAADNSGITIDGNGYTVSYLATMGGLNSGYGAGVFSQDSAGLTTIKNISFKYSKINEGLSRNVVGGIVGYVYGNCVFENVSVKYSKIEGFGKIGAFVGMAADRNAQITFTDCTSSNNTIKGTYNMGGLAGLVLRSSANEDRTIINNVTVTNNTFEEKSGYQFEGIVELTDIPVACSDSPLKNYCIRHTLTSVSGHYNPSYFGSVPYYYAAYANYYVSYGDSSHDCAIGENAAGITGYIANSEICIDSIA